MCADSCFGLSRKPSSDLKHFTSGAYVLVETTRVIITRPFAVWKTWLGNRDCLKYHTESSSSFCFAIKSFKVQSYQVLTVTGFSTLMILAFPLMRNSTQWVVTPTTFS